METPSMLLGRREEILSFPLIVAEMMKGKESFASVILTFVEQVSDCETGFDLLNTVVVNIDKYCKLDNCTTNVQNKTQNLEYVRPNEATDSLLKSGEGKKTGTNVGGKG